MDNVQSFSHILLGVNFHSKCKILGGVTEFFGKAFLCRFPPENLPRPVVYSVHSLPIHFQKNSPDSFPSASKNLRMLR